MLPRSMPNPIAALNDLKQLITDLDAVVEYKDNDLTDVVNEAILADVKGLNEDLGRDIYSNLVVAAEPKLIAAMEKFYSNEFNISNENTTLIIRTIAHFCTLTNAYKLLMNNVKDKTENALFINRLLAEQRTCPNAENSAFILHRAICFGQPLSLIQALHENGAEIHQNSFIAATSRCSNDVIKYLVTTMDKTAFEHAREKLDIYLANQGDHGIIDENNNTVVINFTEAKLKLLQAMLELEKEGKKFAYTADDKKHSRQVFLEPICKAKNADECIDIYNQYISTGILNYQRNYRIFAATYSNTKKIFLESLQDRAFQLIKGMVKRPVSLEAYYYIEKLYNHQLFANEHDKHLNSLSNFKAYAEGIFSLCAWNLAERDISTEPVALYAIIDKYIYALSTQLKEVDGLTILNEKLKTIEPLLTLEAMKLEAHKPMVAEYLATQGIIFPENMPTAKPRIEEEKSLSSKPTFFTPSSNNNINSSAENTNEDLTNSTLPPAGAEVELQGITEMNRHRFKGLSYEPSSR